MTSHDLGRYLAAADRVRELLGSGTTVPNSPDSVTVAYGRAMYWLGTNPSLAPEALEDLRIALETATQAVAELAQTLPPR
jgi:hypothetical protein